MRGDACVIVNASSGQGCSPEWTQRLRECFADRGLAADVLLMDGGPALVRAADHALSHGARCVVAGGGDGTVSAVAARVAGTGVPLGVLPLGTLNHFAKDLGIPLTLEAAVDVIARGETVEVDAAEVNGRLFINNSSLGLYPDIVLDREHQRRRLGRGKWMALATAIAHAARRYPVLTVEVEVDGQPLRRASPFVFIGNNAYRMEGFEIGEREALSQGRLSLYMTQRTGRFGLLALAVRALFRRLEQARDFDMLSAASLVVHTRRPRLHVATDGEVVTMATPLRYGIHPRALRVFAPVPRRNQA